MRSDSHVDRPNKQARPAPRVGRHVHSHWLPAIPGITAFPGFIHPQAPTPLAAPSIWWALINTGPIAALGAGVAVMSADPIRPTRRITLPLPCEYRNDSRHGFRDSNNQNRRVDTHGLMAARLASINDASHRQSRTDLTPAFRLPLRRPSQPQRSRPLTPGSPTHRRFPSAAKR